MIKFHCSKCDAERTAKVVDKNGQAVGYCSTCHAYWKSIPKKMLAEIPVIPEENALANTYLKILIKRELGSNGGFLMYYANENGNGVTTLSKDEVLGQVASILYAGKPQFGTDLESEMGWAEMDLRNHLGDPK